MQQLAQVLCHGSSGVHSSAFVDLSAANYYYALASEKASRNAQFKEKSSCNGSRCAGKVDGMSSPCTSKIGFFPCGEKSVGTVFGSPFRPRGGRGAKSNVSWNRTVFALEEGAIDAQENREKSGMGKLRVGLLCGGPSQERGISLNSARSVLDHLQGEEIAISCYYLDTNLQAFSISASQMYSNTPSDFDYKLSSAAQGFKSLEHFLQHLESSVDIVFPILHGQFGEDGGVQSLLESGGLPYVGTSAAAAKSAFDKATAAEELGRLGFPTIPSFLLEAPKADLAALAKWFDANRIDRISGRVVVKPSRAGSSVGVSVAVGVATAAERAEALIAEGVDDRIVVEAFAEGGKEFTAIVLDAGAGDSSYPVTLVPTEVELMVITGSDLDGNGAIFDYRKKYLPTRQVLYHSPPRFPKDAITEIRSGAAALFRELELRDFARVDGWFFPASSSITLNETGTLHGKFDGGTVVFSDINLMSGMEQTSFLFQQAAQVGLSHMGVLRFILGHACSRFPHLPYLSIGESPEQCSLTSTKPTEHKKKVFVLFGGNSSERQVSLISGTNIWLKLRACPDLEVTPFLLTPSLHGRANGETETRRIWSLPYSLVLRHTVEEIVEGCMEASRPDTVAAVSEQRSEVLTELKRATMSHQFQSESDIELPKELTLTDWIAEAKDRDALVFIAVHGDIGENGVLQELLEDAGVLHTGSGAKASRLCMDKAATGEALARLSDSGVLVAQKHVLDVHELFENGSQFGDAKALQDGTFDSEQMWDVLREDLQASSVCVKPLSDGCSTGVARLCCPKDLEVYLKALLDGARLILPGSLREAHGIVEMPDPAPGRLLLEAFIETDDVRISSGQSGNAGALREETNGASLSWKGRSRWLEVTIGVVGRKGEMYAFNPSITVKESGAILSLEEKFQGGTGVNLTPPPSSLTSAEAIARCRDRIALVANTLGIEGFARIDAFFHVDTGEVIIIEANTVPGMTPSTVLFHQTLAEEPPMYPKTFFMMVIDLALQR